MNAIVYDKPITYEPVTCCACGLTFGVPETWVEKRREAHDTFYYPNGHSLVFRGKTAAEKERERLQAQLDMERRSKDYWRTAAESQKRAHATTKGKLTRTLNRVHKGVCPHCNRSFENLARHMATKHQEAQ